MTPEDNPLQWTKFKELFLEKYFSLVKKNEKEVEFITLTQENLSLVEYERKFDELSRYAPKMVNTKKYKAKHFEVELRPNLYKAIIGMNCLSEYRAHNVCQEKRVLFSPLNGHFFEFEGTKVRLLPRMISAIQAQKCLQFGCRGIIVNVFNMNLDTQEPHHIKIVSEFLDVIPEELPQMPPD